MASRIINCDNYLLDGAHGTHDVMPSISWKATPPVTSQQAWKLEGCCGAGSTLLSQTALFK